MSWIEELETQEKYLKQRFEQDWQEERLKHLDIRECKKWSNRSRIVRLRHTEYLQPGSLIPSTIRVALYLREGAGGVDHPMDGGDSHHVSDAVGSNLLGA